MVSHDHGRLMTFGLSTELCHLPAPDALPGVRACADAVGPYSAEDNTLHHYVHFTGAPPTAHGACYYMLWWWTLRVCAFFPRSPLRLCGLLPTCGLPTNVTSSSCCDYLLLLQSVVSVDQPASALSILFEHIILSFVLSPRALVLQSVFVSCVSPFIWAIVLQFHFLFPQFPV